MQEKFLKNISFLLLVNILVKPVGILIIEPAVQNTVGTANYGLYNTLFSFSLLMNIFLDFGINNFNNRNISQNQHLIQKHISSILTLRMLLSGVYLVATFIFAFFIGYGSLHFKLLIMLCFNQIMASTILYLRSNIAALQHFRTDSIISITDRVILIVVTAILLINLQSAYTIEWFLYTQTAAYVFTLIVALIILGKKAGTIRLRWSKAFSLMILKKSFPYALLILLMTFYNRVDVVMLERMLPVDGSLQSGIYAQAFRLLEASNMIGYLFAVLLLPLFSSMLAKKQPVMPLAKMAFTIIFIPVIIFVLICLFYNHHIMALLYKHHVDESAQILSIIMISLACICANYIFGTLLTANGNLRSLNKLAFAGMIINISLNLFLIPQYKALGAAIAGSTTQLLMSVAQLLLVHRMLKFDFDKRLLMKFVLLIVAAFLLTYLSTLTPLPWMLAAGAAFALSVLFAFIIRLFKVQQVISLFNPRQ